MILIILILLILSYLVPMFLVIRFTKKSIERIYDKKKDPIYYFLAFVCLKISIGFEIGFTPSDGGSELMDFILSVITPAHFLTFILGVINFFYQIALFKRAKSDRIGIVILMGMQVLHLLTVCTFLSSSFEI